MIDSSYLAELHDILQICSLANSLISSSAESKIQIRMKRDSLILKIRIKSLKETNSGMTQTYFDFWGKQYSSTVQTVLRDTLLRKNTKFLPCYPQARRQASLALSHGSSPQSPLRVRGRDVNKNVGRFGGMPSVPFLVYKKKREILRRNNTWGSKSE